MKIGSQRGNPRTAFLSHGYFFANDLVVFSETYINQKKVINDCLERFCLTFGQRVGREKFDISFSKNVNMLEFLK